MNAQALAVNDDDDDEDIQINGGSERADALIAAVENYYRARSCVNRDERLLAATEEDLLNMSRRFFEW